jgi:small subunit ribosomal protein S16
VVVADQRAPRDGDFVEVLGHYNPRTEPSTLVLKEERVKHWLSVGAQPSETVHRMLHKAGLTDTEPPKRTTKQSKAEREAIEPAARAESASAAVAVAAAAETTAAESADEPTAEAADEAPKATTEEATASDDSGEESKE